MGMRSSMKAATEFRGVCACRACAARKRAPAILIVVALIAGQTAWGDTAPPPPCEPWPACAQGGDFAPVVPGTPQAWERGIDVAPYATVNVVNGNVITTVPIASWSGKGPALEFDLYHNSADGTWRRSYSRTIENLGVSRRVLTLDDGRRVLFSKSGPNAWGCESGYFLELVWLGENDDTWQITTRDQWRWVFRAPRGGDGTQTQSHH